MDTKILLDNPTEQEKGWETTLFFLNLFDVGKICIFFCIFCISFLVVSRLFLANFPTWKKCTFWPDFPLRPYFLSIFVIFGLFGQTNCIVFWLMMFPKSIQSASRCRSTMEKFLRRKQHFSKSFPAGKCSSWESSWRNLHASCIFCVYLRFVCICACGAERWFFFYCAKWWLVDSQQGRLHCWKSRSHHFAQQKKPVTHTSYSIIWF